MSPTEGAEMMMGFSEITFAPDGIVKIKLGQGFYTKGALQKAIQVLNEANSAANWERTKEQILAGDGSK